jgi:hypothetical protein
VNGSDNTDDLIQKLRDHARSAACAHTIIGDGASAHSMGPFKGTWHCVSCGMPYFEIQKAKERSLLLQAADALEAERRKT